MGGSQPSLFDDDISNAVDEKIILNGGGILRFFPLTFIEMVETVYRGIEATKWNSALIRRYHP